MIDVRINECWFLSSVNSQFLVLNLSAKTINYNKRVLTLNGSQWFYFKVDPLNQLQLLGGLLLSYTKAYEPNLLLNHFPNDFQLI